MELAGKIELGRMMDARGWFGSAVVFRKLLSAFISKNLSTDKNAISPGGVERWSGLLLWDCRRRRFADSWQNATSSGHRHLATTTKR